jgi:hypothetical protein
LRLENHIAIARRTSPSDSITHLPNYPLTQFFFPSFFQSASTTHFSFVVVDFQIDDGFFAAIERAERLGVAVGSFVLGMDLIVHIG